MRSSSGAGIVSSTFAVAMKKHARQVERQVEVVVAERVVLRRVEHLEHRRGGVAAEVGAHLVDLVDHHHRVHRAGVADRPHDHARHRADVGAPVAADLRLVAHAAHRDAGELAPQRAGDRLAQRGLAHAGRADEGQDRACGVLAQPRDRELLDDPLLDLVDVVVVLVEDLAGAASGRGCPRWSWSRGSTAASRGRCGRPSAPPTPRACARAATARARRPCATSSGGSASASWRRSSSTSACSSSASPSSSRIALSCWRRKNSRWPLLQVESGRRSGSWRPSSSSSSSRLQSTVRRRRRASRSDSSSSSWRSSTDRRIDDAIR